MKWPTVKTAIGLAVVSVILTLIILAVLAAKIGGAL